jgi:hypothetical protein
MCIFGFKQSCPFGYILSAPIGLSARPNARASPDRFKIRRH